MRKPTIVSILTGTWRPRGGMTSSVLLRMTKLAQSGYRTVIFTLDYRADQIEYEDSMRSTGAVGRHVEFRNYYEHYRQLSISNGVFGDISSDRIYKQVQDQNLERFFSSDGRLLYNERKTADGRKLRRYFDNHRRVNQVEDISASGKLHKRTNIDPESGKKTQVTLLNQFGGAYAISWKNNDEQESGYFVYEDKSDEITFFKNARQSQIKWLNSEIGSIEGPVVLILDNPENVDLINDLSNGSEINFIGVLHGNHLSEPSNSDSSIKPYYSPYFMENSKFDAIVASTSKQAKHLSESLLNYPGIHAIPQAVDDLTIESSLARNDSSFAFFGRLVPLKRIPGIITAFSKVQKIRPSITLDIYGEGSEESKILTLIRELGLQDSVRLCGYESEVYSKMTAYNATIFCSQQEGFGLVVAESMLCTTPVIAMNCNYGPSEIIDKNTGILIEDGDFEALSDAILWCTDNVEKVRSMGDLARRRILDNFSRNSINNKWTKLISEVSN